MDTADSQWYESASTSAGVIQSGQWHHVAGVIDRDAGQMRIYVDGQEQTSVAVRTNDIFSHSSPLLLGATLESSSSYSRFSGRMDEVRIWDTARSETEIQANQNQVLVGNEPGLAGYWRFEETAGLVAANEVTGGDAAEWQGLPDLIQVTNNANNHLDGVTLDADISLSGRFGLCPGFQWLELNARATIGTDARLQFDGTQTLGGTGEVVFSTTTTPDWQGMVLGQSYTTLTIDDGITVRGGNGTIGRSSYYNTASNVNIINHGTIDADTSGRTIHIDPAGGTFTNEGTLRSTRRHARCRWADRKRWINRCRLRNGRPGRRLPARSNTTINGASLTLRGTWDNRAALTLTDSTFRLSWQLEQQRFDLHDRRLGDHDGTPTDLGSFSLDGSDLFEDGTLTTALIDQLNLNNITLTIRGTLDNTGDTLEIGEGTAIVGVNLDGGTIRGGTVSGEKTSRWSTGQLGGGVQLDNSRYLSVPHSESIDPRRQVTVETWIYVDAFDSTWQPIIEKGNGNTNSQSYRLLLNSEWFSSIFEQ